MPSLSRLTLVTPSQQVAGDGQGTELIDAGQFVLRALRSAHAMGKAVEERLDLAVQAVYLALVLTVLSFGLAFAFPPFGVIKKNVFIDLTPTGSQLVSQVCGTMTATITGGLEVNSLSKDLAAIDLGSGDCPMQGKKQVTLVIPVADIKAIAEKNGTPPFYP